MNLEQYIDKKFDKFFRIVKYDMNCFSDEEFIRYKNRTNYCFRHYDKDRTTKLFSSDWRKIKKYRRKLIKEIKSFYNSKQQHRHLSNDEIVLCRLEIKEYYDKFRFKSVDDVYDCIRYSNKLKFKETIDVCFFKVLYFTYQHVDIIKESLWFDNFIDLYYKIIIGDN